MKMPTIVFCMLFLAVSTAQAAGHKLSEWNKKDCVELEMLYQLPQPPKRVPPTSPGEKGMYLPALAAAGISVALTQAVTLIKKKIKESDLKFMAQYNATTAGSNFFVVRDDGNLKDLKGIQLTRYATHPDTSDQVARRKASSIILALHREDNGAFSFTVKEARVWYAKCKIKRKENAKKEPPFPTIDLRVTVAIRCFWLDAGGIPRSASLGQVSIPVNAVPVVGESLESPAPEPPPLDRYCPPSPDAIVSWFPPFPTNHAHGPSQDVAYVLSVTVNEFDDYADMVKKYGEFLSGTADVAQAIIQNLLDQWAVPEQ